MDVPALEGEPLKLLRPRDGSSDSEKCRAGGQAGGQEGAGT